MKANQPSANKLTLIAPWQACHEASNLLQLQNLGLGKSGIYRSHIYVHGSANGISHITLVFDDGKEWCKGYYFQIWNPQNSSLITLIFFHRIEWWIAGAGGGMQMNADISRSQHLLQPALWSLHTKTLLESPVTSVQHTLSIMKAYTLNLGWNAISFPYEAVDKLWNSKVHFVVLKKIRRYSSDAVLQLCVV